MRTAKTLIRLGGCPGWSESSLGAQPLSWFCHEVAQIMNKKDAKIKCKYKWWISFLWRPSKVWTQSVSYKVNVTPFTLGVTYFACDQLRSWGARWLSGRVSDSGARGRGFDTYRRRVVSLSKTLYSPKVLVNYPGSGGSVPTWLKNCWLGR